MSRHTLHSVIAIAITVTLGDAHAQPPAVGVFCQKYPNSPQCLGQQPSCTFCHIAPPQRNVFGSAIEMNLAPGMARPLSDSAFAAALRIPNLLQTLFGEGVLSASFIPVYAKLRAQGRSPRGWVLQT